MRLTDKFSGSRIPRHELPMTDQNRGIDKAAFGVVCGSIMVITFLMAMRQPIEEPGRQTLARFGTVAVVAVAKPYAEICERVLTSGENRSSVPI